MPSSDATPGSRQLHFAVSVQGYQRLLQKLKGDISTKHVLLNAGVQVLAPSESGPVLPTGRLFAYERPNCESCRRIRLFFCRFKSTMDDLNKVVGASLSVSSKTAAVGFICLFVAGIIVVFKRLVLHPLSCYPGPLVGRLTSLYNTYHAFRKDQARNLHQLHEKYGPIVRYGPNHVSIRSAEGVKMLYTNSRYTRKADNYLAFPRNPEKASLFSSINKQVHARKRRILRQGFSDSALKTAGVTIKKHVATLCQCLEFLDNDNQEGYILSGKEKSQLGSWSKPKNFSEWINRFTFDVSSDLSFSKSFEMMRYAGNRHIIKILHETLWADNVTGSSLTLLHKLRLKWLLFLYHVRSTVTFDSFIEKAAGERVSKISESKKDFMFWLTGAVDPVTGDTFTMEELVEEAILLITAGSDTSSTAISSTIYYLLHSPGKLARLQEEVRNVFTSVDQIEFGTELQACTYLRACINEGLRLSPPAGSVLHRQVEPGGVQVGDHLYPEGVNIGVPVFSIHHDKEYFPDPFSFQPERWIVGEMLADGTLVTTEFLKSSSGAFMAFSAGTRGCIGKPLAYLQISILFATLMFRYDMRLCQKAWVNGTRSGKGPDPSQEYELVDMFISWKNGPLVEVKPRE